MFEKFINRFKLNFKLIIRDTFKISGTIFSVLSILFVFFSWDDLQISSKKTRLCILFSFCLLSIIFSTTYVIFIKKSRTIWKKGNASIKIEYGDIIKKSFSKSLKKNKEIYVIPVNTCFDTIVDKDISNINCPLVSSNTIHGKWINGMRNQNFELEYINNQISKSLFNQNIIYGKLTEKSRGNINEYPIGTAAIVDGKNESVYFLLALSTFDQNNMANCTKEEFIHSIESLVEFNNLHSQGYDLYIPLMGTNLSRANLSHSDSLEIIYSILKINDDKIHNKIHIVIYKDDKDKVSIYDI